MIKKKEIQDVLRNEHLLKMFEGDLKQGFETLKTMNPEDADNVFSAVLAVVFNEIGHGLGLYENDYEAADYDSEKPIFEAVQTLYSEYSGGCYFCNPKQEMNEKFTRGAKLCLPCSRKLGHFLDAIGVKSRKVFPFMPPEPSFEPKNKEPDGSLYNILARTYIGEDVDIGHDDGKTSLN